MGKFLVTGASGQDGLIAIKLLTDLGHPVAASSRSEAGLRKIQELFPRIERFICDVEDASRVNDLVGFLQPEYVLHLAGASSVAESWEYPTKTFSSNVLGTLNILEAIRKNSPHSRALVALSSEIFPREQVAITVNTTTRPSSPYGVAKEGVMQLVRVYREVHGCQCFGAILFNHESPLRPAGYVSQRIAHQVHQIRQGEIDRVYLQNPGVAKDFSWAPDIVRAMITSLIQGESDIVLGSGVLTPLMRLVASALTVPESSTFAIEHDHTTKRLNDDKHPYSAIPLSLHADWHRSPKPPEEWMPLMVEAVGANLNPLWFVNA